MSVKPISIVQYWVGYPRKATSKWVRFLRVVQRCAERGWQNHLVWSQMPGDPDLWSPFVDCGCQIHLDPGASQSFDWPCVWRTYRMLRRIGANVFHCHNVHTSPLIGAALAGVPVRLWSKLAMSLYYEKGTEPRGIHKLAPSVRVSCALATRTLAVSRAVRSELLRYGVCGSKLTVMPCPVDVEFYANASSDGVREALGFAESDLIITTVGQAVSTKGWDILIRAFDAVSCWFPRAHLLLVGRTAAPEAAFVAVLTDLVETLGLDGKVHFAGERGDIAQILKASDIFVCPSRSEGHPLALKEGMAAGLPCVGAAVGGIPELITDGANGFLFPREDVDRLARHLIALLSDRSLRDQLGQRAQQESARFDMAQYVDSIVDLYGTLSGAAR